MNNQKVGLAVQWPAHKNERVTEAFSRVMQKHGAEGIEAELSREDSNMVDYDLLIPRENIEGFKEDLDTLRAELSLAA